MNLRVVFQPLTDLAALSPMRELHLAALAQPQAPLLEVMVHDAAYYEIHARQRSCGYLIVRGGDTLIELYLHQAYWVFGEVIVKQAIDKLGIHRALVQQFDALFLSSCVALQDGVRSIGLIARDYVPRPLPAIADIRFTQRTAELTDLPAIRAVDQEVFTHPERLAAVVSAGFMQVYERDEHLVGFGIMRPVSADGLVVELGIAVDRPFRARGYAVYMLRSMIEHCVAQGLRPIGGCTEDNTPSRHMAERVGLVSRFRLLELSFKKPTHAHAHS